MSQSRSACLQYCLCGVDPSIVFNQASRLEVFASAADTAYLLWCFHFDIHGLNWFTSGKSVIDHSVPAWRKFFNINQRIVWINFRVDKHLRCSSNLSLHETKSVERKSNNTLNQNEPNNKHFFFENFLECAELSNHGYSIWRSSSSCQWIIHFIRWF